MSMFRMAALSVAAAFAFSAAPATAAPVSVEFAGVDLPRNETVVLPVAEGGLTGSAAAINAAGQGALEQAMAAAGFKGKAGEVLPLYGVAGYRSLLLVGVGKDALTRVALENYGARAFTRAAGADAVHVVVPEGADAEAPAHIANGAKLGSYSFDKYRTGAAKPARKLVVHAAQPQDAAQRYQQSWQPVAEGVAFARDLVNEPGNALWPETFVERTREAFKGVPNVTIEALDVAAMEKLGMGALLGVGQGSKRPPRLMVVQYRGAGANDAPVVFAGKGITFDSGGISLKPSAGMEQMKYDMTGAATATGTVLALAKRGAKVNAVAIAALAENMPGGGAIRPGDVLKTMSGKTIEVISTDAEGRLVLADAVTYAQARFKPRLLVDIATLTGAVRTALGDDYAGLFSRHDAVAQQITEAGRKSGEEVWRLPLHPDYASGIASDIADIKGSASGRAYPGAGIGAQVIGSFVTQETPWAHLDIASVAWLDSAQPTKPRGATAFGIRLLDQVVRDYYEAR